MNKVSTVSNNLRDLSDNSRSIQVNSGQLQALQKALDFKMAATMYLKRFDNDKKIELLHLLMQHEKDANYNLTQIVALMRTAPQSNASVSSFIRHMVKAGAFQQNNDMSSKGKKSSKYLQVSPRLKQEYLQYLELLSSRHISSGSVDYTT